MSHEILSTEDKLKAVVNYKLCTAIDMTGLRIVLGLMKKEEMITTIEEEGFANLASSLLSLMREANWKHFATKYAKQIGVETKS